MSTGISINETPWARALRALKSHLPGLISAGAILFLLNGLSVAETAPAPLGLDVDGRYYALISNGSWQVTSDGGGSSGPAKAVKVISTPVPGARGAQERQNWSYIWAPACVASKQTLTFRRTFFLPGPAKTFAAQFWDTTHYSSPATLAIASTKVSINGHVISFNGAAKTIPIGTAFAHLLRFGQNVITITVVKRPDGGASSQVGKCKYGKEPLGIAFTMSGEFQGDLWLWDSSAPIEHWQRASSPNAQLFVIGARPRNHGPSGEYKGTLTIDVSGGDLEAGALSFSGQGLRNCTLTSPSASTVHVQCEVFRYPVGGTPEVQFKMIANFPPGYNLGNVYVTRYIWGPGDGGVSDNRKTDWFYICSPTYDDPRCSQS